MARSFDFLVVGGGMGGVSAGFELSRHGTVAVLEREEQLAVHSTGRSAAIFMETYGNGPVRALTSGSRGFYEAPPDGFAEEPLIARRGALFLAEAASLAELRQLHDSVRTLVPTVQWLGAGELGRLVPCLAPERWVAGLFEPGAVDLDVHGILQGFARGLKARGGAVVQDAEVTALRREGGLWTATTPAGQFSAPVLVNAAGAWADRVGQLAGARPIGLTPLRRTAITVDAPGDVSAWPFVSDVAEGFYFKPDARRLLVSPVRRDAVGALQRRARRLRRGRGGRPAGARHHPARRQRGAPLGRAPLLREGPDAGGRAGPAGRGAGLAGGAGRLRDPDGAGAGPALPGADDGGGRPGRPGRLRPGGHHAAAGAARAPAGLSVEPARRRFAPGARADITSGPLEPTDPSRREQATARRRAALGVVYVAASALCFGAMPVFARQAYADGVDPRTLLLLRFSIAAAMAWVIFALRRSSLPRGRGLLMLIGMGAIGYAGQSFSYFTALTLASAGLVALLLYLFPALVALLSWLVLRHPLSRLQVVALVLALAGSLLTIGRAGDGAPLGIALGLAAALIYSVYILVGARLPAEVTPTASTAVVTSAAAAVYALVALARGVSLPATSSGWLAILAVAVIGTVMAIAFFLAGLERLGAVKSSVYSTLEPAFTLALAAALLGEPVTLLRVAGGALILGAVLLLARADLTRAAARPGAGLDRGRASA